MSIKHASWIHGTAVELENKSWSAARYGPWTTVRPSNESTSGWVHFAIPAPVVVNGVRVKAQSVMLRFSTGPHATIGAIHVYDGEKKILNLNGTNYHGSLQYVREVIPKTPEVHSGLGISLYLNFNGNGHDAYVQLISAGIDF